MIYLSQYKQKDCMQNHKAEHQLGRKLLVYGLWQEYHMKDEVIQEEGKKPRLKNSPQIHFNISHSGGCVVCVIARDVVGIDVEYIRPFDVRLMRRICSEEEIKYINEQTDNQSQSFERFFRIWTLKESFVKAIGEGLAFPLKNITFKIMEGDLGRLEIQSNISGWKFRQFRFQDKYIISVCEFIKNSTKKEEGL